MWNTVNEKRGKKNTLLCHFKKRDSKILINFLFDTAVHGSTISDFIHTHTHISSGFINGYARIFEQELFQSNSSPKIASTTFSVIQNQLPVLLLSFLFVERERVVETKKRETNWKNRTEKKMNRNKITSNIWKICRMLKQCMHTEIQMECGHSESIKMNNQYTNIRPCTKRANVQQKNAHENSRKREE